MLKIVDVKKVLADALISVSTVKDIERVTVQDIVEAAHTSRRTFYNHFQDKYDLINWIYREKIDQIMASFTEDNYQECMRKTYEIFYDNRQFFTRVINMEGQNSFREFFVAHTAEYFYDYIVKNLGEDKLDEEMKYSILFNCYGQVGVCLEWIREGMQVLPEVMAERNVRNLPDNLRQILIG